MCEVVGFSFLGLCHLKSEEVSKRLGKLFSVRQGHSVCLHLNVCEKLVVIPAYIFLCFISSEVARMLFVTVFTFTGALFWFLAFTEEI